MRPDTRAAERPAVLETRLVHEVHRRATADLADAVTPAQRDFVVAMLRHHHEAEDHDLWPLLAAAEPAFSGPLGELTGEHRDLDVALDVLAVADPGDPVAAEAAATVRDLVHRHLDHEEPVLFPALDAYLADAAWDAFSRRTVDTFPAEATEAFVRYVHEVGPDDAVALLLRHVPAARP